METIYAVADKQNTMDDNAYFVKLPNSTLESFAVSQVSFIQCIDTWSKALGVAVARASSVEERRVLLNNLNDENGSPSHIDTFLSMLQQCGRPEKSIADCQVSTCSEMFCDDLLKWVNSQKIGEVYLILGGIEYYYLTVCKHLNKYLTENIGSAPHYDIHSTIDVEHAAELFKLSLNYTDLDIADCMEIAHNMLFRLYDDLALDLVSK